MERVRRGVGVKCGRTGVSAGKTEKTETSCAHRAHSIFGKHTNTAPHRSSGLISCVNSDEENKRRQITVTISSKHPSDRVAGLVIPDQQRLRTSKVALPCRLDSVASVFA